MTRVFCPFCKSESHSIYECKSPDAKPLHDEINRRFAEALKSCRRGVLR